LPSYTTKWSALLIPPGCEYLLIPPR
jgi:hypothetical protein